MTSSPSARRTSEDDCRFKLILEALVGDLLHFPTPYKVWKKFSDPEVKFRTASFVAGSVFLWEERGYLYLGSETTV